MKYFISALKYIKSNALLWLAYAVAAVCVAAVIDVGAIHRIVGSFSGGYSDAGLTEWIFMFLPFNTHAWWTVLISLAGYVVLIMDLAFICATTDRHMRYNSLSARGLFSSINNDLLPCAIMVIALLVIGSVMSVLLAGVMKAVCSSAAAYMFILGIIICVAIAVVVFYVLTFFSLWLPCFIITGFRAFESLSYAYSLGANERVKLFLAMFIPAVVILASSLVTALYAESVVAAIVISLLAGALAVYVPVLSFTIYIDADGIAREDLKKF